MSKNAKVHLALIVVNLIYGANLSVAKIALPEYVSPGAFIFLRVAFSTILFFLLLRMFFYEKIDKKDIVYLFFCGLFGVAINQIYFFKGLSITTEINAGLLMITTPILIFVFTTVIYKEKVQLIKILGVVLGCLGALILLKGNTGKWYQFNSLTIKGDVFIILNAISYAVYMVMVKKMMKKYQPLTVITWVFAFGLIPVTLNGFQGFQEIAWSTFTMKVWLSIGFVLFFTTFLTYLLNVYALKHASPTLAGIYIYLQPVFAVLIGIIMQQKPPTISHCIASVFIFIGVYLVSSQFATPSKA